MANRIPRAIVLAGLALGSLLASAGHAQTVPFGSERWLWGSVPEESERTALTTKIRTLSATRNFAGLSALEAEYRIGHETTRSGVSKLTYYFALLGEEFVIADPETCETDDRYHSTDEWRALSPQSPAPILFAAERLQARAWCLRAQDKRKEYAESIEAAIALLEANKAVAAVDPEYYAVMATLYTDAQRSKEEFRTLLEEATAADPYYYHLYFQASRYFKPEWGGSFADVEAFGRYAIEKTRARDGAGIYARYYWNMFTCGCIASLAGIDWLTMRTAMDDLARQFPDDWTLIHMAQIACTAEDAAEARKFIARLTFNDPALWPPTTWEKCRTLIDAASAPIQAAAL